MIDLATVVSALRSYDLFERVKDSLQSKWFPSSEYRNIVGAIKACHDDRPGRNLPWKDLRLHLRGRKGYDKLADLERRADGASKAARQKMLTRFLQDSLFADMVEDLSRVRQNGEVIDTGEYIQRFEAIQKAGSLQIDRTDFWSEDPSQLVETLNAARVIPLPIGALTAALKGGLVSGRPTTILARTDAGKTSLSVAVGAHALTLGYNVLHITLEDSKREVLPRYYSCLTRHSWAWIVRHPRTTKKILNRYRDQGGALEIADFSAVEATPHDCQIAADRMVRHKGSVDLIIVDAGDDLRSTKKFEPGSPQEAKSVWNSLTRLSKRYDAPVMVTTQSNRAGAEAKCVELTHIAESWGKATVSAVVLVFDVPLDSRRGQIRVVKSKRKGTYPTIPIIFDRERCVIQ